jgi:hypothetical protein
MMKKIARLSTRSRYLKNGPFIEVATGGGGDGTGSKLYRCRKNKTAVGSRRDLSHPGRPLTNLLHPSNLIAICDSGLAL